MTPLPRQSALRSWGRRIAVGIAAVYVLYLVAGNALLNSAPGHELANRRPERFVAGWTSAWTLYPGHVYATGVRIAGHTRRTVWSVQADSATGRVALLPLLAQEIRVPTVTATGVTGGASLIDVALEPAAARPGGWTLRFPRIVANDVRHVYFDGLVLQGRGSAESGFVKVLRGGPMEVLPSQVRFDESVLWGRSAKLAWDAALGARFSIDRHRREEAPGIRKLERTDLEIDVDAKTGGLMIESRGGHKPDIRVSGGPGAIHGRFGWRRGSLVPGGRLEVSVPVEENFDGTLDTTPASLQLRVGDEDIRLTGRLAPTHHQSVRVDADFTLQGRELPLTDFGSLAPRSAGHVAFRWQFDSIAWLAAFLPSSKLVSFDGAGSVLGELRFHSGRLDPGSFLEAPRVAATASTLGNRFAGDARLRVTLEEAGPGQLRPHLQAVMDRFSVAPSRSPDRPYVHGEDLRIDALASGEREELRDRIQARLWFEDAEVPDIRVYNRYLPKTSLQFRSGSGRLSGDLRFDRAGGVSSGQFRMRGQAVELGLLDLSLRGDIEIDTHLRRADLKAHAFSIDGSSVELRGVRASDATGVRASDWWGRLDLEQAQLDWNVPMHLDATLAARMKDASVLLAMYSQRKDLPDWVARIVDSGEARATGRVQWRNDELLLEPFEAGNDRFDLAARLRLRDKHPTGDLLASWGALSVGVELDGPDRDFHVTGARKWFDRQPPLSGR